MKNVFFLICCGFVLYSCENHSEDDLTNPLPQNQFVRYTVDVKPIIDNNCVSCHGSVGASAGLSLTNYTEVKSAVVNNGLLSRINDANNPMPSQGLMPATSIQKIEKWNTDGLLE